MLGGSASNAIRTGILADVRDLAPEVLEQSEALIYPLAIPVILAVPQSGLEAVSSIALSLCALLLGACAAAVWVLVVRLGKVEKKLAPLDRLEEIQKAITKTQEDAGALDLKRIEHALIDIRDGQKRVEDRTLAVLEAAQGGPRTPGALATTGAISGSALADRIVTRLLALGYERIQLVTPLAKIAELAEGKASEGEVSIEARRDGAACKGRIFVKQGAIVDVQIQSAYSVFP